MTWSRLFAWVDYGAGDLGSEIVSFVSGYVGDSVMMTRCVSSGRVAQRNRPLVFFAAIWPSKEVLGAITVGSGKGLFTSIRSSSLVRKACCEM